MMPTLFQRAFEAAFTIRHEGGRPASWEIGRETLAQLTRETRAQDASNSQTADTPETFAGLPYAVVGPARSLSLIYAQGSQVKRLTKPVPLTD